MMSFTTVIVAENTDYLADKFSNENEWADCMIDAWLGVDSRILEVRYNVSYMVITQVLTIIYNPDITNKKQ